MDPLPQDIQLEEGGPDDAYCDGDDEHLASVDFDKLPELEEKMETVTTKDEAKAFYDELAGD